MSETRISCDVDLSQNGKQVGSLKVPYSRNASAWGSLFVPIAVIKNGDGPTLLLVGGNHGDEYEGQVALTRLIQTVAPDEIRGRVIVLPALNLPAVRAGTRLSPIDGGNMNRAFPGDPKGNITSAVAHYVDSRLLPIADAVLDLHSGGTSLEFTPCVVMHDLDDPSQMEATRAACGAFGAPHRVLLEELDAEGLLDTAVEQRGKVFVTTELGGGGRIGVRALEIAEAGVRGFLHHFGAVEAAPARCDAPVDLEVRGDAPFVVAETNGLFAPRVELGARVEAGDVIGELISVEDLRATPRPIGAKRSGIVLARRALARTERGDCLFVIASVSR